MARRPTRYLLPGLLAALMVAGAAWGLWPRGGAPAVGEEGAEETAAAESAAGARLVARPTSAAAEGPVARGRCAIEGVVRRLGVPIAARVAVYSRSRPGSGVPDSWLEGGIDPDLPAAGALGATPLATAAASEDGRYRVAPLDPGAYEVAATAPDGARGAATVKIPAEGCVVGVDVDVRWGPETFSGRTVRADGSPWRGHVAAYPAAEWASEPLHGLVFVPTDEEGRFTLLGLEKGRMRVLALQDRSFRVTSPPVSVPRVGPEWVFVVDAGLREIAGRALDDRDGRPLPGVSVVCTSWSLGDGQTLRTRAVTDAEGRYKALAPASDCTAAASLTGYVTLARVVGEGQKDLDFRLVRSARIHGRVLSEGDGAPQAGVSVLAITLSDGDEVGSRTASGPDGRYEFPEVAPGSVMLAAFGGGWWSKGLLQARPHGYNPLVVEVKADASAEVDLVVVRAAKAAGKTVDAKGSPVAGALVGWTGSAPAGSSLYDFPWAAATARTASGPDGTFLVDALIPGFSYTFQAAAPGQSAASAGPLEADLEKPLAVELKFPVPRWLDATVEDPGGRVLAGAIVQTWFQTFGNSEGAQAVTDPRGKARVGPLPEGQVWAMAHDPGSWNGNWQQLGAADGEGAKEPVLTATLQLTRGVGIRGRLKYTGGSPVSDRSVSLQLTGPDVNWSTSGRLNMGWFAFDGVQAGTYRLEVKLDTSRPPIVSTSVAAGPEEIEITVPADPAKRTVLDVVDGDGKPVPQALVLHAGGDEGGGTATLYDGRYKLLPNSGEAWVELYSPSSPAGTAIPWAPQTVGPIAEGVERLAVKLEPERRIEGVVHGPDGRGVRGVRVRAIPTGRSKALEGNEMAHDATLSDAEGRFRLGRLWAGEYRLFVEAAETYAPCEPITVQSGNLAVDVPLLQGLAAAVPVEDWRGRPLAKAVVTASIEGRQNVRAVTDAAGIARLVGLDRARSYKFEVEVPGEGQAGEDLGVVIDPWKPSEEPVRLRRAVALQGVVRGVDGSPVGGARVTSVGPAGETNTAETEGDGKFEFGRVAPGEYRLFAGVFAEPHRTSATQTVTAGGRDVVLVVEPALELKVKFTGLAAPEGDTWVSLAFDGSNNIVLEWTKIEAGVATFRNVHPDATYQVYLRLDADPSRIAFRRHISAKAGELTLPFETARAIRGRLVAPKGAAGYGVRASLDGLQLEGEVDAEGRYEVKGLPDGTYRLHGWALLDGAQVQGEGEVAAGGSADLDLRAR